MIVSRIRLKNWRNFREVNVDLRERMFLVGPNASGKSNFLDAFRFLRDIAKSGGGLQQAIQDRGGLSKIRCLAARKDPDVEIEIELSESITEKARWKYAIGIRQEPRGTHRTLLTFEKVWSGEKLIVNRPDTDDEIDDFRLVETHLEQISANAGFREIAKLFDSILYLHLVPQLIRHPEAFTGTRIPGDPFGQHFLARVAGTTARTRDSRLKKIGDALRVAVPQLKELQFTKDASGAPHLEAVYEHWRPGAGKQREDQFSDGTIRLLGLLWALLESESLLLLEEPELSLNAGIVSELPALIYKLQRIKKRQVLISTHSADLLSDGGIDGRDVLLLIPSKEGTKVEVASSIQEVSQLLEGGMNIADALLPRTNPPKITSQKQLTLFLK